MEMAISNSGIVANRLCTGAISSNTEKDFRTTPPADVYFIEIVRANGPRTWSMTWFSSMSSQICRKWRTVST